MDKLKELTEPRTDAARLLAEREFRPNFAEAWGLGGDEKTSKPTVLSDLAQGATAEVAKFETDADTWMGHWKELATLLDVLGRADAVRERSQLAKWVTALLDNGPQDGAQKEKYQGSLRLAADVLAWFKAFETDPDEVRREALLNAGTNGAVEKARGSGAKGTEAVAPSGGVLLFGAMGGRFRRLIGRGGGGTAAPASLGKDHGWLWWASWALCFVVVELLLIDRYRQPAALAVTVFATAGVALVWGVVESLKSHRIRLLVSGLLGWALAAAFGGADALDASKGWGSTADIMKTIGLSFTVAGTTQILRLGFPKVDAEKE